MKGKIKLSIVVATALVSSLSAQTIELKTGWNLIGIQESPYNGKSWSINSIVDKNKNIEEITNITRTYTVGAKRNSLTAIEPGKGYWVKVKNDTNLTINGAKSNISLSKLSPGWSLIALPISIKSLDGIKSYVNSLKEQGLKIEVITNITRTFNPNAVRNSLTTIDPNSGYWVKVLKQVDAKEIGNTGKKLIVYTDKEFSSNDTKKTVTITVDGIDVEVEVPSNTTKAEIRIVDEFGKEIVGGEVINPQTTTTYTINKDINTITSVAYYVMSANPSGVPQPLSDVKVYDKDGNLIGKTDANGIISISKDDIVQNSTLLFEKDGFSVNSVKFNLNNAIEYVVLSPSMSVDADELSSNENTTSSKLLNKTLNKYYAIRTVDNKAIGLVKMDYFSTNPNLSKVSFSFSTIDSSSFYGKDKLKDMVAEYEDNGIKYVPQIITGVQGIVKIGGIVSKGDDIKFSKIDKNGQAELTYYLPRFFVDTSYIRTQQQMAGAKVEFYAFDGEGWRKLDENDFELVDVNETSGAQSILKKLGYCDNDLVAKVKDTSGVETVVGVLWNKIDTLKVFENIKVKVTETDGTPIKNALVKVLDQQVLTDKNGTATFTSIKVPNDLANLTFEVTEPHHYRNLDRIRIDDLSNNKTIEIALNRPPSTGTVNISTIDNLLNPVEFSTVDIITPAVLADVEYKNGVISVGKEDTAEYHWYIKPNISTNSNARTFRTLSKKLLKLNPNAWTEVASGVGKNSITIGELFKTIIKNGDPAVGSVKLAVYVKHKNGLKDGNETNPINIGQADIMFNKAILERFGLEKIEEDPYIISKSSTYDAADFKNWALNGKADAKTPYLAFSVPTNIDENTLEVKWNVLLVYEKDSDNQYYWNGQKWIKSEDLKDATVGLDYIPTIYNIAKENNFEITTSENYLTFSQLASFMSKEDVVKALFIKKDDVDNDSSTQNIVDLSKKEDSVLAGNIRLIVVPEISFKDKIDSSIVNKYVTAAETQLEGISVADLLNLSDVALQPASILPHHIYAKTSEDGMLRIVNIPFEFGNAPNGKSYLDVLAKKVGYLDSQRQTIPKFKQDDPNTPELEDVANVTLKLHKREKGSLQVIVVDKDTNQLVSDAKLIVPSSVLNESKDKIVNLLVIDNDNKDLNETAGGIKVSDIFEGGYNISVLKDGYKPANASVVIKKDSLSTVTVKLEKLDQQVTLTKPFVDELDFTQSNEYLTVKGKVIDTEEGNYSKAAKASLVLNGKVIDIKINDDGSFSKTVKLDRGVNEAALYVSNAKGTFNTSTKTFIYIGDTAYFHGYVLDQDNNPLENAIVEIDTDDGETIYRVTNSDGLYEVNDMPVGEGVISAVYIDENGFIYNDKENYQIDKNDKDVELNLTIKTQKLAVSEPADIYIDRYNGASELPSTVSTDKLKLTGRVVSFDKENGAITFEISYDDGTSKIIDVDNKNLTLLSKDSNTYSYSVELPLKDGLNYIFASAENPVYGGSSLSFAVEKTSNNNATNIVKPNVFLTTPSGLPVYATVAISKLDNTPVGVYEASDYNSTTTMIEPELEAGKYYIFDITADGFKEIKEVKFVNQDTNFIYFTLNPTNDFTSPTENKPPKVSISYYNYQQYYEFEANAFDPDGDELTYTWKIDNTLQPDCTDYICSVELAAGDHNVSVTVDDGQGHKVNKDIEVNVSQIQTNHAPEFESFNVSKAKVGEAYYLQIKAKDEDGDTIYYGADNLPDGLYIDDLTGEIRGYPQKDGTYNVTLHITDGKDSQDKDITIVVETSSNSGDQNLSTPPSPNLDDQNLTPPSP